MGLGAIERLQGFVGQQARAKRLRVKPHGLDVAVGEYPFLATLRDRGKAHGQPEAEGRFDVEPRELGRLQEGIPLPSAEHAARMPFDGVERRAFVGLSTLIVPSALIDRLALIVLPALIDRLTLMGLPARIDLPILVDPSAFGVGKPFLIAVHDLTPGPVVRFQSFYAVQLCHVPPLFCAFNHTLYGTEEAGVTHCGRASPVERRLGGDRSPKRPAETEEAGARASPSPRRPKEPATTDA